MIIGIGGKLSGGKTVTAVRYAYKKAKEENYKVIANIKLNMPDVNYTYMANEEFIDFVKKSYDDPIKISKKFSNSVIIIDELSQIMSSRSSSSNLNNLLVGVFMMFGKISSDLVMTYQVDESMVDKVLRECRELKQICFRLDDREQIILGGKRKVGSIRILIVSRYEFGFLGSVDLTEIYDPTKYFNMYDTGEIVLLNRAKYQRGGSKDLRK